MWAARSGRECVCGSGFAGKKKRKEWLHTGQVTHINEFHIHRVVTEVLADLGLEEATNVLVLHVACRHRMQQWVVVHVMLKV